MHTYEHPRPALAVDIVVFTLKDWEPCVLLVERAGKPFQGMWALPGGFVRPDETVETACSRELEEETGVRNARAVQCAIFSKPDRDPRGWVVSVAYFAFVRETETSLSAGSDAAKAQWFSIHELPPLAFDHAAIIDKCALAACEHSRNDPLHARMLPPEFTLSDLQRVSEIVWGGSIDKRNFRRMLDERNWVKPLGKKTIGRHRPAELYTLSSQ